MSYQEIRPKIPTKSRPLYFNVERLLDLVDLHRISFQATSRREKLTLWQIKYLWQIITDLGDIN